jgi:SAM-dependent methyltransferase
LRNVSFELGDAQIHPFPAARFDLCISRFGTMFFADPVAAFTNVGRAMRPGARLVMMVWQSRDRNEWSVAIQDVLAPGEGAPVSPAFSLGDRAAVAKILSASGFGSVEYEEVHAPVYYGADVAAAYEAIVGLFLPGEPRIDAKPPRDEVLNRLHALVDAHLTSDGVQFDSRAWIVTARKVR